MKAKAEKMILITAELVVGLTGLASGVVILTSWHFPLEWLQGYWLSGGQSVSTVPALTLTILIGGGSLLAAWLVHTERRLALFVSVACGAGIATCELAAMMIVPFTWVQPLYVGFGVLILAVAGLLWVRRTALQWESKFMPEVKRVRRNAQG